MEKRIGKELLITARNLPRWQEGGRSYFVTFKSAIGDLSEPARQIVVEVVRFDDTRQFDLFLGVVMPDHVHLMLRPLERAGGHISLGEIMKPIKGISARRINALRGSKGRVWQDESYDRIIRVGEFADTWNYLVWNPILAGLADQEGNYPFMIWPRDEHVAGILENLS